MSVRIKINASIDQEQYLLRAIAIGTIFYFKMSFIKIFNLKYGISVILAIITAFWTYDTYDGR